MKTTTPTEHGTSRMKGPGRPTFGITPMLATAGPLPKGDNWIHEIKWDGMRVLIRLDRDGARIFSRNGIEATGRFPELAALAGRMGIPQRALPVLLDGEIVAFNETGVPDFGRLQRRIQLANEADIVRAAAIAPAHLAVFDIPVLAGSKIIDFEYRDRRKLLEQMEITGEHISVPRTYEDGQKLLDRMVASGMEGVVAKRLDGRYLPGKRSRNWIKVKSKPRQEFVVGGWTGGTGRRSATFGSLLLGVHEEKGGPLLYVGNVGTGFSDQDLELLSARMHAINRAHSPFINPVDLPQVQYVKPELVVEVEYQALTSDRKLRHPVFKGTQTDKLPADVVFEDVGAEL